MNDNYNINAILEDDLIKILNSQGLLKQIEAGLIKCTNCGCILSTKKIGAIQIINGVFKFKCDSDDCKISDIEKI